MRKMPPPVLSPCIYIPPPFSPEPSAWPLPIENPFIIVGEVFLLFPEAGAILTFSTCVALSERVVLAGNIKFVLSTTSSLLISPESTERYFI